MPTSSDAHHHLYCDSLSLSACTTGHSLCLHDWPLPLPADSPASALIATLENLVGSPSAGARHTRRTRGFFLGGRSAAKNGRRGGGCCGPCCCCCCCLAQPAARPAQEEMGLPASVRVHPALLLTGAHASWSCSNLAALYTSGDLLSSPPPKPRWGSISKPVYSRRDHSLLCGLRLPLLPQPVGALDRPLRPVQILAKYCL